MGVGFLFDLWRFFFVLYIESSSLLGPRKERPLPKRGARPPVTVSHSSHPFLSVPPRPPVIARGQFFCVSRLPVATPCGRCVICHMPCVVCRVLRVMCHVSCVTRHVSRGHVSRVLCQVSYQVSCVKCHMSPANVPLTLPAVFLCCLCPGGVVCRRKTSRAGSYPGHLQRQQRPHLRARGAFVCLRVCVVAWMCWVCLFGCVCVRASFMLVACGG